MAGCEVGRTRVLGGLIRLIWENGSARLAWRHTVGRRRWLVTGVGRSGTGNLVLWGKGVPECLLVKAAGFFGQGSVANGQWVVQGLLALLAVIRRMCLVVSPPSVKVSGAKGLVALGWPFDTGAGVGGKFLPEVVGGGGGEVLGKGAGTGQVPSGPPPSHRDQAVSALQVLVGLLEPAVGAQVRGLVEGLLPPKPASPAPATPTHAQVVARLHKLYDSETQLVRKVDEVEGRVEKARARLVEEEAALAKVQGELQGVKDQIMASLRDEADCRERTRKGGTDTDGMEDAVTVEEDGSSEEVGTEVEKGKGRKVLRRGRFSRRGGTFGESVNLLDVIRILKGLSKEDRGRCMRSAEIDEALSSMSGGNSGGAAEGLNLTLATVLTPCG